MRDEISGQATSEDDYPGAVVASPPKKRFVQFGEVSEANHIVRRAAISKEGHTTVEFSVPHAGLLGGIATGGPLQKFDEIAVWIADEGHERDPVRCRRRVHRRLSAGGYHRCERLRDVRDGESELEPALPSVDSIW